MKKTSRPAKAIRPAQAPAPAPASVPAPAPETVLFAVTGMSPAILTETLWALAHPADGTEPVIPHRVIAVTTTQGRDKLAALFDPSAQLGGVAPWDALRAALQAEGHDLTGRLRFGNTADDLRVITAADPATGRSRELADIRDRADNEAAADFLLEQVRAIVENPDTRLIASVAGGRKTMSALLYACLTLVGRETDRLTHVLVSEPFETLRDFWFPAQPGGPLPSPTRSVGSVPSVGSVSPATATLDLADVPFVPLRNLFHRELGAKPGSFLRLVENCRTTIRQQAATHLRLTLDTARAELEVNGQTLKLAPTEMLVALFLARRAKHGEPAYAAYKDALDDLNTFRQEQLQQASARDFNDWRHADSLRTDCDDRFLVKATSSLRDKLRQRGGDAALLAACLPEKGRCSLDLPGPMIFIQ
ncbi:MAG: TIGR02584 family CRISPR-associated protein [Verrucomicrobia bacterium]|jgi:CRISPR-associated protein (TIGR02584 family)|nr:TIGR02584 family CRISPR-associated protein [Verrucomicrobiota bacterium]